MNATILNLLSGAAGAVIILLSTILIQSYCDWKKEKTKYINLLSTASDEIIFYTDKLKYLIKHLHTLVEDIKKEKEPIIPTFCFYPELLKELKFTINTYQKDSDIIILLSKCHFELSHINERLIHQKRELFNDNYQSDRMIDNTYGFVKLIGNAVDLFDLSKDEIADTIKERRKDSWIL